jgi:glutathione synthase/RimK-type ligase-like ATP-grasp enzyme
LKILFYYEGDSGRGLRGKRARKHERQGFNRCQIVEQTRKPHEADLIYARNIPERTSDGLRQKMVSFLDACEGRTVLNHPCTMLLHDSKDRTFAAWKAAGINAPEHIVSPDQQDLLAFVQSHPHLICRINNLACGDQTVILDNPGRQELEQARQALTGQAEVLRTRGRDDTRPMAVTFVDSTDRYGFIRSFRVFIVGDTVYGGFVLISRQPIVNHATSCCATEEEVASFLYNSSLLDSLLEDSNFCSMVTKAVQVLGLDIGCLDFVLCSDDQEIFLLEANALWTPSFSWAGGKPGRKAFKANQELWQKAARSYCRWMNRVEFYRGMYDLFAQFR